MNAPLTNEFSLLDLYQVISENAPDAIKNGEIKNHFGRKVAIVCSFPRLFRNHSIPNRTNNKWNNLGCVCHFTSY